MRRRFVIGDIHGNLKGLVQVLRLANFNKSTDILYFLGDVVDGWGDDYECLLLLMELGAVCIKGNHDEMFIRNLKNDNPGRLCLRTLESFESDLGTIDNFQDLPFDVQMFLNNMHDYVILGEGSSKILLFHAGFNRHFKLDAQPPTHRGTIFNWDRDLWLSAIGFEHFDSKYPFRSAVSYSKIYIGHTPTLFLNGADEFLHMKGANVINVDTGGGFAEGRICMLNIDNHEEVYYSDYGHELYDIDAMKTIN